MQKNKNLFMKLRLLLILLVAISAACNAQQMFTAEVKGHGTPIIFIHGLYCTGDVWAETVERFQKNHECHVLTLAGFGGNAPKLNDHFLETVKDDVIAYARRLKKPVLVGHSMGGFISFWAASTAPGVFSKVIAVDGLPFLPDIIQPGATPESSKDLASKIKGGMENQTAEQILKGQKQYLPMMISDTARVTQVAKIAAKSDPKTQAEVMYELYTVDLRRTIATIDCPVMLMGAWIAYKGYGATRESSLARYTAQVAELKGCKVELNDTAKHFIFLDDPQWFFAKTEAFLGDVSSK